MTSVSQLQEGNAVNCFTMILNFSSIMDVYVIAIIDSNEKELYPHF